MKNQALAASGLILTAIVAVFIFAPAHNPLVAVGVYIATTFIMFLLCGIAGTLFFQRSKPGRGSG